MPAPVLTWGAGGTQAFQEYQLNQQRQKINDLAIQSAEDSQAAKQQNAELEQRAAKILSDIAKGNSTGTPSNVLGNDAQNPANNVADTFYKASDLMLKAGMPAQAQEYMKAAQTIGKSEATIDKDQATAAQTNLKNRGLQADLIARTFNDPNMSDEQYQEKLGELQQSGLFTPDELAHIARAPNHPAAIMHMREAALSIKDQVNLKQKQLQDQEVERHNKQTEAAARARNQIAQQRVDEMRRQKKIANKTGVSAPTGTEIKDVTAAVKTQVFPNVDAGNWDPKDPIVQSGVREIANRAKTLFKTNQGLSWNDAVNRAVIESQANGDWDTETETHWFSPDTTKTTGFSRKGKNPADAMPIPINNGSIDTGNLKTGKWYISPTGKRGKWNGQEFIVPSE